MPLDGELKNLSDIFAIDPRCNYPVGQLEDFHAALKKCELSESVPQGIRENFCAALHAMLYSWYAYPLSTPALLYAIATLELALKEKLNPPKEARLKRLLNCAVEQGLIEDNIFLESFDGKSQTLVDVIPRLRNGIAHGEQFLVGQWNLMVFFEDIAAVINNLFKPANDPALVMRI